MNDNNQDKDINEYDITPADVEMESATPHINEQKAKTVKSRKLKSDPQIYEATVIQKTRKGQTGVCFNGFGLSVPTDKSYNAGDTITIEYTGEIGKPDFKYRQV